ncbi:DUF411 domain-containing protein [Acuticoccus yangtzensis]|uniref:DUF411 domain-containing protein n=1 Tax=Acuticoccus yangtzensis TaxID=1443441 RepID=UPI001FE8636F|nr:DUF411 domain-containing protein [Acuticoccus yangtzensis]
MMTRQGGWAAAALALVCVTAIARPAPADADPAEHRINVAKTPWCGCCGDWADHMARLGYEVEVTELTDLSQLRSRVGVPQAMEGCHMAVVEGYVLEGHVPPEAIARLLSEKPDVRGIAVPGMPAGSVGMGNDPQARYDVFAFGGEAAEGRVFYRAGVR